MYGSNYYGQAYYGQGPAIGTTFILSSVLAIVTAGASISFVLLLKTTISATVVATASIQRMFIRTLDTAVITALGSLVAEIFDVLNIRRASTKFLTLRRSTRTILGFDRTVEDLNKKRTTRLITDPD